MAGGGHEPTIHMDPAYVKYNQMQIERFKFFRWTPRTTFISLLFVGVIPGIFGYMGYVTDGKWEMRGKRRGDPVSEF